MNFLIASAMAQDAAQQPSAMPSIIMLVLIVVVFWFLLIRPQMKRNKEHRELVASLSKGDEIVIGGLVLDHETVFEAAAAAGLHADAQAAALGADPFGVHEALDLNGRNRCNSDGDIGLRRY